MTKTQVKNRKKFIKETIKLYVNLFNLQRFSCDIKFEDLDDGTAMCIETDLDYLRITVWVDNGVIDEADDKTIVDYIKHELTHVLLEPLAVIGKNATSQDNMNEYIGKVEAVTEHISRLL